METFGLVFGEQSGRWQMHVTKGLSKNYVTKNLVMKSTRFSPLGEILFSSESS